MSKGTSLMAGEKMENLKKAIRDIPDFPNALRIVVGDAETDNLFDNVYVAETNIDDMNPQYYEYVMDLLFKAGALDVFMTPIHMKKQRPGITLSVILNGERLQRMIDIVTQETTSLGVRFCRYERVVLKRESVRITT